MVADKSRRATEAGMRVPSVLVAWLWCACHSVSPPLPASLSGNYRFVEQPATMNEPIVGGIVIRGDTLIAVNDAGVCEYDARASQHDNVIVYRCGIVDAPV
jgi:hypothetical protein